jgi:tetratricopeptide (TPR) repeat protein
MSTTASHLRTLADEAEVSDPPRSYALWRRVAALATEDPAVLQEAGVSYMVGYALYNLAEVEPNAARQSTRHLEAALAANPDDSFAKLYLGHLAFDAGEYEVALGWFDAIPEHAFVAHEQRWRDVKRQELRICCLVHLARTGDLILEFERYLSLACGCETTDVLTVHELPLLLAGLSRSRENAA